MNNTATSARYATVLVLLWLCLFCIPAARAASIDDTHKYAWSENAGWQNWRATNGQATVHSDHLTGFVWPRTSAGSSWARTPADPYAIDAATNWGVNRNGVGNLSGYAWSETNGLISTVNDPPFQTQRAAPNGSPFVVPRRSELKAV